MDVDHDDNERAEVSLPAADTVARWYSIAPEPEVAAATYRLERTVAGWATVTEQVSDRTFDGTSENRDRHHDAQRKLCRGDHE